MATAPPQPGSSSPQDTEAASKMAMEEEWGNSRFLREGYAPVDLSSSDEEDTAENQKFVDTCAQETRDKIEETRNQLHAWSSRGAQLHGDAFGQKNLMDKFENLIVFDDDNKCFSLEKDEQGMVIVTDITLGLRMAQRHPFSLEDALRTIIDTCGNAKRNWQKEATTSS